MVLNAVEVIGVADLVPPAEAHAGADASQQAQLALEEPLEPDGRRGAHFPTPRFVLIGVEPRTAIEVGVSPRRVVEVVAAPAPVRTEAQKHGHRAVTVDVALEFGADANRIAAGI